VSAEPRYADDSMMKSLTVIVCSIVGAVCGATLLNEVVWWPVGAFVGFVVGWLLGKFIPWYDWFI